MKKTIKQINIFLIVLGLVSNSFSVVFAQYYDTGTTYPTYDTGTSYSSYNTGTTYPSYDTGTNYSTYNTGTSYSSYDTGTTYPTYTTGTTYPTYDTGTTYPTYTTGTTYTPTVTTIPTTSTTICSNGSYPVNGVCSVTTTIPTTSTTVCSNGSYPVNGVCSVTTTIPTTSTTVCSNGSYPVNGVCSVTTTIPTTVSTICSNGQLPVNGSCASTVTIPSVITTRCSDGSYPVNGSCSITNTIPTTVSTLCSNGQLPVNGSCTINNTIPVTVNTRCSDGSYPVNGSCSITNTIPTVVNTICSDGLLRNLDGTCTRTNIVPATQVCFDGSRISVAQTCPSQYKTCPNGTSVLYNQSCYSTPVYVPPTVVKFNNVVTSIVTQITNTSGRCNGIGLIANGAQSKGWFEYGETANLGRVTASASIGTAVTAPFSNVLANLKPNTKYYCRAVMENQYGVVKGEIVSFVTKAKATTYVKPVVVSKPVVKTKTVTTKKSNIITCSDGSTFPAKDTTTATVLAEGGKLISLEIQRVEGTLSQNAPVAYKVIYKNTTESRLTDVVVKVTLPAEVQFISSTSGNYDEGSHTLTLNQDTMDAHSEGSIAISGVLAKDAPVGKTIVATSYVVYTVPGTYTQDEVTAYVVGSIVPTENISHVDTGAKKVVGNSTERGFMPNNLVEWLALIAIIFIIFILGRSIYVSYKEGEGDAHAAH